MEERIAYCMMKYCDIVDVDAYMHQPDISGI